MHKLETNLNDFLKRINFILKNEEILTECNKSMEAFTIFGEKFGPYEREKRYKLPFFTAMPFIENNILSIASSEKCDHSDVQRYSIEDRDNEKLIERENKYFLNKIKEFKKFMKSEIQTGRKAQEFLNNYNSYFSLLLERRLLKVLNLSRSELNVNEEDKLSESERFLYKRLNNLVRAWRNFFLS